MTVGTLNKLSKLITKYVQGQFLRKLEIESEDLKLRFEIIPVVNRQNASDSSALIPLKEDATGTKKIKVGDQFQILIYNDGIKPAYFNLIDIQPDNIFNFLLKFLKVLS